MVTGHQIEVFSQFAKARIERGRVATSIFVLLDERQRENPPKEDQLSIEASLRDMEAGDAGQALGQFAAEFRDRNGLFGL